MKILEKRGKRGGGGYSSRVIDREDYGRFGGHGRHSVEKKLKSVCMYVCMYVFMLHRCPIHRTNPGQLVDLKLKDALHNLQGERIIKGFIMTKACMHSHVHEGANTSGEARSRYGISVKFIKPCTNDVHVRSKCSPPGPDSGPSVSIHLATTKPRKTAFLRPFSWPIGHSHAQYLAALQRLVRQDCDVLHAARVRSSHAKRRVPVLRVEFLPQSQEGGSIRQKCLVFQRKCELSVTSASSSSL